MPVDNDFRTPGQLIAALRDQKGWTNRVLSIVLDISEDKVSRLVTDRQGIDVPMALSLEDIFSEPAERFLELQRTYDLAKARIATRPDPERATRAHLFGGLPVAEMIKRQWIDATDIRDVAQVQSALTKFFGVDRVEDIEILPHAAKKTQVNIEPTPAQSAWLYRVKQIASEMLVHRYSPQSVLNAIPKLKLLLAAAEEARKVPRILAESGIRFVIVESLPSAKIDGVCFWLNDKSPVIALSLRFDRIDNFWFVLRHELEHVIQGHGRSVTMLDVDTEGARGDADVAEEERIANEAAADFCVPTAKMNSFVARKAPYFYERDIIGFARTINVHPGLVAGQIRRRTGQYNKFGNHLVKIRSIVAPSAIVDGWGDVAPVEN